MITPRDGKPLGIAVIYEDRVNEAAEPPERLSTFVMVTTPPNAMIGRLTDRMSAILDPGDWEAWLGETGASLPEVKALL